MVIVRQVVDSIYSRITQGFVMVIEWFFVVVIEWFVVRDCRLVFFAAMLRMSGFHKSRTQSRETTLNHFPGVECCAASRLL